MPRYLSAAAVLVLGALPASAADMYSGPSAPLPAGYSSAQPWSGFFLGVNGGYAWKAVRPDIVTTQGPDFLATPEPDSMGAFGGGQAGYNWQSQAFLLGIVADIQGSDIGGSVTGAAISGDQTVDYQDRQSVRWFGTVRGRAGYVISNFLAYATGGFAYGEVANSVYLSAPGFAPVPLKKESVQTGFTVGGGLEYAFDPAWSIGAEYQYIDFGNAVLKGPNVPCCGQPQLYWTNGIDTSINSVRISLNYHLHIHDDAPSYKP
jgi:outer membrane immunogenic protein